MENFRLRVFRTVARSLNFRKASEELLISQPAVTQQVKALEEEVGVPLFDRTKGKVTLTPSGAVLLEYAEKLKVLVDEAAQAIAEVSGTHHDALRVGASQTIGQYLLPNLLAGFMNTHPGVELFGISGNTGEMLEALIDHRIDLALIEGPDTQPGVKLEPFMEDHLVLIVPPGHAWADHEISPQELAGAPLITRELRSGSRRVIEDAFAEAGVKPQDLHYTLTLDSTEGLLSAVEAGLGLAFASRWAVRNQLTLGTLRVAHVKGLQLARVFSIAYRQGPPPQGSAGAFHRYLMTNAYGVTPRATGKPRRKR